MIKRFWPLILILIAIAMIAYSWVQSFWPEVNVNFYYEEIDQMLAETLDQIDDVDSDLSQVPQYQRLEKLIEHSFNHQLESMNIGDGQNNVGGIVNFKNKEFLTQHHRIPFEVNNNQVTVEEEEDKAYQDLVSRAYYVAREKQKEIRSRNSEYFTGALLILGLLIFAIINLKYARQILQFGARMRYKDVEPSDFSVISGQIASGVLIIMAFFLLASYLSENLY